MIYNTPPPSTCAVSVVIPMFNAERFIRQCLISVLASKFTDYEVIVVDDCSTDNSVAEVEKLLPHFDGRLKILSTETNSGGAGIPRNVGIKNSSGKYVTFVDNDDMILPNALGDFFALAENFQADVVHTEKYFAFNDRGEVNFTWDEIQCQSCEPLDEFVDVPFMESKKLDERIRRYVRGKFFWLPWGKCFRRDFLLANEIDFPQMEYSEDMVFCFKCLCLAENYLRVPAVTNIHRIRKGSASLSAAAPHEKTEQWLKVLTVAVQMIDEFMNRLKFFRENPNIRRDVLKFFVDKHFSFVYFRGLEAYKIERILFDEMQKPELNPTGKDLVAAQLYTERFLT